MKTHVVLLELRDLYAVKHALQMTVRIKKNEIEELNGFRENGSISEEGTKTLNKLEKDIGRETDLILRMQETINEIKAANEV